ncbi:NUDIX domain-containing protein [Roseibium litorale]|uniref:NUDIX domain-containing protein n=1 Tax=Roseibium litorale TaxID=2803841 RepID=A0ABR9CKS3_9HYPH|nr:NUDIX domain-containing protein [Roseibium litorale]MBD8891348.1 NUDIX domain-containing protein [Roseibium litorale]
MIKLLSFLPSSMTKRLVHAAALLRNPYCVGVRVLVLGKAPEPSAESTAGIPEEPCESVLLVRHSYLPGWYLPGGGVDRGETMQAAARRELSEETGIVAQGPLTLLGAYLNRQGLGRDHVGLFLLRDWDPEAGFLKPNAEIVEAAFFPMNALPADLSPATARRLQDWIDRGEAMASLSEGYW